MLPCVGHACSGRVFLAGRPLEAFAAFVEAPDGDARTPIGQTGLAIQTLRSTHSELCYGFRLYFGDRLLLGWTVRLANLDGYCCLMMIGQ